MSTELLREVLHERAADVDALTTTTPLQRAHAATRRARVDRVRRTRLVLVTGAAAAVAVAAVVVVGPGGSTSAPRDPAATATSSPSVQPPSGRRIAGVRYSGTLRVDGATYWLATSYVPAAGSRELRVEATPSATDQVLAWSSSPSTRGQVLLFVDGREVSRSTAGALESGLTLSAGRSHVVVVRAPALRAGEQLGLATYDQAPR